MNEIVAGVTWFALVLLGLVLGLVATVIVVRYWEARQQ